MGLQHLPLMTDCHLAPWSGCFCLLSSAFCVVYCKQPSTLVMRIIHAAGSCGCSPFSSCQQPACCWCISLRLPSLCRALVSPHSNLSCSQVAIVRPHSETNTSFRCCRPLALTEAVHPAPAPATSPFANAIPETSAAQASTPPWLTSTGLELGSQAAAQPAPSETAARADSMDAMLASLDSEQSAARLQRMSSLTLSCNWSAMLESNPHAQWQVPI